MLIQHLDLSVQGTNEKKQRVDEGMITTAMRGTVAQAW